MTATVKKVRNYFKTATKAEVDSVLSNIFVTERQENILSLYLKGKNLDFIADENNVSLSVVNRELKIIRDKIMRVI